WRTASRPVDVPPGRAMPASPACRRDRARACRACRGAPPDPDRLPAGPVPGRPSLAPAEAARRGRVLPAPRRDARIRRSPDVSPTLRPEFEHLCEPDGLPIRAVRRTPRRCSIERSSAAVAPPYPSVILRQAPGRRHRPRRPGHAAPGGAGPGHPAPSEGPRPGPAGLAATGVHDETQREPPDMTTTQAPEDGASPLAARDGAAQDEQRPGPVRRRWCLGTRLVVAATAVWAVVLTLHVLLVDRWWPWLIFEVAPPLILVVVPLLLLVVTPLARPVRRRLSVVLVVLLLAGAYLAGFGRGWAATPTAGGPAGTTIKVFAWNTNYWDMSDDKGAFYAFLRRQDADVYLLQEYLYWDGDRPVRIDDTARLRAEFPGYRVLVQGELLTLTR